MRINGIPDGGQQETTANTTKLVTDLIKSIDPDLNESDIIRSHRIGNQSGLASTDVLYHHTKLLSVSKILT